MKAHQQVLSWLGVGLYALLTLWLMCAPQPLPETPRTPSVAGLGHFVIFGGLAGMVAWGLHTTWTALPSRAHFWIPIGAASAYGVILESAQYFIPERQFDLFDIVLNIVGALCAQILLTRILWRRLRTSR